MPKKYTVAMPAELDYITELGNKEEFQRQLRIKGKSPDKAPDFAPQDPELDTPIPYHLTPLGISVVENGHAVAEFHRVKDFDSFVKSRSRANSRKKETGKKVSKADIQRDCQLSIYDEFREEELFGQNNGFTN